MAAVLLYSYGLSLFREELGVLREALHPTPASKSSIHEWVRKVGWWVGGRLNFDPHPQEYSIIAVCG